MKARIDDPMVIAHKFLPLIFGNLTEFIVHIGDIPLYIGDGHNSRDIQSRFLLLEMGKNLFQLLEYIFFGMDIFWVHVWLRLICFSSSFGTEFLYLPSLN